MTSAFLDTYQRYKQYTDDVAQWLVDTAVKRGLEVKQSAANRTPVDDNTSTSKNAEDRTTYSAGTRRPKSKARNLAKKSDRAAGNDTLHQTRLPSVYKVGISDFLELARGIADNATEVVSRKVLELIRTTIDMRRTVSSYYMLLSSNGEDSVHFASRNASHEHFIEVLERVFKYLEPLGENGAKRRPVSSRVKASKPTDYDALTNRFSLLVLEEPHDEIGQAEPREVNHNASAKAVHQKVIYQDEKWQQELDFAIWCLFSDLHCIQGIIQNKWKEVASGSLELTRAAILTNAAIMLVRIADENFRKSFPGIADEYDCLISPIYERRTGCKSLEDYAKGVDSEVFRFLYAPTDAYIHNLPASQERIEEALKGSNRLIHEILELSEREEPARCFPSEFNILRAIFCSSLELERKLDGTEGQSAGYRVDELSSGLFLFSTRRTKPLWIAFAAQVYLDILSIMGPKVINSFMKLKSELRSLISLTKQVRESSKSDHGYLDYNLAIFTAFEPILTSSAVYYQFNPVAAGEALFYVRGMCCGILTLEEIKCGRFVSESEFLYDMLRRTTDLASAWPDMDQLFQSQNHSPLSFVSPITIRICRRRYLASFALSQKNQKEFHKLDTNLKEGVTFHDLLLWRYNTLEAWSILDLEKTLKNSIVPGVKLTWRPTENSRSISYEQILDAISLDLAPYEFRDINDLVIMAQSCRKLCERLAEVFEKELKNSEHRPFLKTYGAERLVVKFIMQSIGTSTEHQIIWKCVQVMRDFIKEEGDAVVKRKPPGSSFFC